MNGVNYCPSRSSKVIDFGTNRKSVYILLLVVNSNLDPILHRFRDMAADMSKIDNFPYPTPILAKIWGVPFGVDPSSWGLQRVKWLGRLITCESIMAEFQPI